MSLWMVTIVLELARTLATLTSATMRRRCEGLIEQTATAGGYSETIRRCYGVNEQTVTPGGLPGTEWRGVHVGSVCDIILISNHAMAGTGSI